MKIKIAKMTILIVSVVYRNPILKKILKKILVRLGLKDFAMFYVGKLNISTDFDHHRGRGGRDQMDFLGLGPRSTKIYCDLKRAIEMKREANK